MLLLAGVILLLSSIAIASFLVMKDETYSSSASLYEFYNRLGELKRLSYHDCQNFRAQFTHDFGEEVEFYDNSNYVNSSIGTVRFQNVRFLTRPAQSLRARTFQFTVSCSGNELQVSVR